MGRERQTMNRQARNPQEALVPRLRRYAGTLFGTVGDARSVIERAVGGTRRRSARPDQDGAREETALLRDRVRRTFLSLPEDQRDILHLVCVEGLSYGEVAEIYAVDVVTVMSRLVEARLALHAKLAANDKKPSESAEAVE
jgi:RNA polymerase sigma factor (sigma-70 family)